MNTKDWITRPVRFDHHGKRLSGIVTAVKPLPPKGNLKHPIPDYELTIQGRSGKRLNVSLYETYATINT